MSAPDVIRRTAPDPVSLQRIAAALADLLQAGDVVILRGPLGAGKTTFAQGVGAALGISERLTSPTFVIARVHHGGRLPLVHADAYRLSGIEELDDLDLDTELDDSVVLVEWGSGLAERLAQEHLVIDIARADDSEIRTVAVIPSGPRWRQRLAGLDAALERLP